uniref:Uncharacterized protein n=1 Tax=Colobus angolensis palliatus TaxID=336983 RepID=A0A2K5HM49_COLAP
MANNHSCGCIIYLTNSLLLYTERIVFQKIHSCALPLKLALVYVAKSQEFLDTKG